MIYLLLYVDDILISSNNKFEILKLKRLLSHKLELKDLGSAKKMDGNNQIQEMWEVGFILAKLLIKGH